HPAAVSGCDQTMVGAARALMGHCDPSGRDRALARGGGAGDGRLIPQGLLSLREHEPFPGTCEPSASRSLLLLAHPCIWPFPLGDFLAVCCCQCGTRSTSQS